MCIRARAMPEIRQLGRVAVLMGGSSAEREISLMSGQGVLQALREQGVDAHAFDPHPRPLQVLEAGGFDRVCLPLHGRGRQRGRLLCSRGMTATL